MKILLGTVAGLIGAGGAPINILDPAYRLGAVTVLGAALIYQIKNTGDSLREISKALIALQMQCAASCKRSEA